MAVVFHVNAMTSLCKRTDGTRGQSRRGAAVAVPALAKAGSVDWLRVPWRRDGQISGPTAAELDGAAGNEVSGWVCDPGQSTGVWKSEAQRVVCQSRLGPAEPGLCLYPGSKIRLTNALKSLLLFYRDSGTSGGSAFCEVGGVCITCACELYLRRCLF